MGAKGSLQNSKQSTRARINDLTNFTNSLIGNSARNLLRNFRAPTTTKTIVKKKIDFYVYAEGDSNFKDYRLATLKALLDQLAAALSNTFIDVKAHLIHYRHTAGYLAQNFSQLWGLQA